MHLRIIGDSPAAEKTSIELNACELHYKEGGEQKTTFENLTFELKNGEEKSLEYAPGTKVNHVEIKIDENGGAKLFLTQPKQ